MRLSPPARATLASAGIVLLATALGLWGLGHGLPASYYPDEAHLVKRALAFGSGDLNPHWFHKPAFFMYILFAEYGLLFVIGKLFGVWASAIDFGVQFVRDPGVFYLIGRLSVLVFALASIVVAIRLGERHLRRGAGLVGGLLLALTAGLISSSQSVKEDVPSMFFAVLSLYWLLNYASTGRLRDLVVASIAGGASAATKAYGMALIPLIVVAVVWGTAEPRPRLRGSRKVLGHLGAAICCYVTAQVALAPFSFLDPLGRQATFDRVAGLFTYLGRVTGIAHVPPPPGDFLGRGGGAWYGIWEYVRMLVSNGGMGPLLAAFAGLGVLLLLIRHRLTDLLLLGYVAVFFVISSLLNPGYAQARHQTPIYPILAAAGGLAIVELVAHLQQRRVWAIAALAATLLWPLGIIAHRAELISREDTRSAAKRWIELNIPAGTRLLLDEDGPQLLATERSIRRDLDAARRAAGSGQFTAHYDAYLELQLRAAREGISYDIDEIRKPWWRESEPAPGVSYLTTDYDRDMGNPLRPVGVASYEDYVKRGFQYAVVHSDHYLPVTTNPEEAKRWPSFAAFYRQLFQRGRLVREFSSSIAPYTGPDVKVYRFAP